MGKIGFISKLVHVIPLSHILVARILGHIFLNKQVWIETYKINLLILLTTKVVFKNIWII